MSIETIGSSVYSRIPFSFPSAAFFIALLICSTVASFFKIAVRSVMEPVATGTLVATPSNLPWRCGNTRPTALAAPVLVGIIDDAAAQAFANRGVGHLAVVDRRCRREWY